MWLRFNRRLLPDFWKGFQKFRVFARRKGEFAKNRPILGVEKRMCVGGCVVAFDGDTGSGVEMAGEEMLWGGKKLSMLEQCSWVLQLLLRCQCWGGEL
jgi:hypothetical protein